MHTNLFEELEKRNKQLSTHDVYKINRLMAQMKFCKDDEKYNIQLSKLDEIKSLISKYIVLIDNAKKCSKKSNTANILMNPSYVTMDDIKFIVRMFEKTSENYSQC